MQLIVEEIGSVQEVEMGVCLISFSRSVSFELPLAICLHLLFGHVPHTVLARCGRLASSNEVV